MHVPNPPEQLMLASSNPTVRHIQASILHLADGISCHGRLSSRASKPSKSGSPLHSGPARRSGSQGQHGSDAVALFVQRAGSDCWVRWDVKKMI
jgi:hypothetical protein